MDLMMHFSFNFNVSHAVAMGAQWIVHIAHIVTLVFLCRAIQLTTVLKIYREKKSNANWVEVGVNAYILTFQWTIEQMKK